MTRTLLCAILLFPVLAFGQDVSVRGMKGLNTIANPLTLGPEWATTDFNWDHREPGSITPRKGYDSIGTMSGVDSIVNIEAIYDSDGEQRIAIVADLSGVGYGSIYLTNPGSVNLTGDSLTKLTDYWAIGEPTYFTVYNDNMYAVNGQHKGMWYNGEVSRDWPIRAPGEPKIIPLKAPGSAQTLDGEYIYRVSAVWGAFTGDVANGDGIVATRVRVKDGHVLLSDFSPLPSDTSGTANTYVTLEIHRTPANPGPLRVNDSIGIQVFYRVLYNDTVGVPEAKWDDSVLTQIVVIDSSNATAYDEPIFRDAHYGLDSLHGDSGYGLVYRYGAPQYESDVDTIYSDSADTAGDYGVYYGIPNQNDTLGVVYACTFIDTASGFESDTGRSAWIFTDTSEMSGAARPYSYTLKLPKIHAADSGLVINVYRAQILQMIWGDTATAQELGVRDLSDEEIYVLRRLGRENVIDEFYENNQVWVYTPSGDSIYTTEFRLVGQYPSSDTTMTDSLPWDDISATSRAFSKRTPPSLLTHVMTHDDRIWGIQGNKVWYSEDLRIDTLQSWGQLDFTSLDASDGDLLTALFVTRGVVRAMKNNSTYNLYETSGGTWSGDEVAGHFGVIAPQSVTQGITGTHYLSNAGVILETEGLYRERQIKTGLLSDVLDNFDKLSISDKRDAVGFKFDREHKYFLSVPSVDTTYVWDERAGQWSTWDLVFSDAILYGTESSVDFIPGDTMYFIRPGDSTLYQYGQGYDDNGAQIDLVWRGGPFGVSKHIQTVDEVGFWTRSDSANDSIAYFVRNDQDATTGSVIVDSLNLRFRGVQAQSNTGLFHSMDILTNTSKVRGDIFIDGYDVWLRKHGDYQWR